MSESDTVFGILLSEVGQKNYHKHSIFLADFVESIHEGVRYPCNQCDYKATLKGNLKKHKMSKHQ